MKSRWMVSVSLLATTGCVVGPNPIAPTIAPPDRFLTNVEIGAATDDVIWWAGFDDETLGALISDALEKNLDIVAAEADLRQTLALVRATQSDLYPTFDASVDSQIGASFLSGVDTDASQSMSGLFGFDPDITGRNKRRLQAAEATAAAAALNVIEQRRLVAQSVALEYIELRRAGARLALLETSLDLQESTVEIVGARFRAGLSPELDVDRAASDLARTRAQRGRLIADRRDAIFTLSVLAGREPSLEGFETPSDDTVPNFTGGPDIGVPLDTLRRRPDLRQAEARLIAEMARIGVEEADLYPSLRLPGRVTASAATSGNPGESIVASLSSIVDIPIFDAGRRQAEVDAQQASADAALANYKRVRLEVLQDVESALVRIEARQSQLDDLEVAAARSQSAYEQLDALYREGLAGFIDVLDAQRNLISSRESIVDTQADIAAAVIGLYTSLGLTGDDNAPALQAQ